MTRKEQLQDLVEKYQEATDKGQLLNASEATMRAWIDDLLAMFGWDVRNTRQVLTERSLSKKEKNKLSEIGSTNTRPDYTLTNGNVMLAFVDAKSLNVDIKNSKEVAFQIRSYGWSIGAPFSIVTNFKELAIYDCSPTPDINEPADKSRVKYLTYEQFVDNFEYLDSVLYRPNVISNNIKFIAPKGSTLDERFAKMLGEIRKNLAKAIYNSNPISSISTLSYYVQTIINRILFIRVCESRGLEKHELLKEFTKGDFWTEFKKCSYVDFYNHYDGPMFKRIQSMQSLTIPNDVFNNFVGNLYDSSPYRFDVIPLKTLSDIYDLFLGYQLIIKEGAVTDELKSEFKKSNGAVTTPERLVKQVIESTLSETVMVNLTPSQIFDLRIIDIACGSSVFLAGVYDYLAAFIEKKIAQGQEVPKEYYKILDNKVILTLEGRKAIINHCIYGVDINPEAVEVSKLSLSLKLIDNYRPQDFEVVGIMGSQILQGIGSNIKCGNSLVGKDIESVCPSIGKNIKELQATNAFDWESEFPEVFEKGGFDFVIGNPPYVEVKNYNVGLPSMAAYIKTVYASSRNGKIDLAIPFIEKGIKLLNANGRLGYIIQKRFFKDQYGKGIRKMLTDPKHYLLDGIYDYEETNLFKGRITYVAILVCDNHPYESKEVWYMNSKDSNKNRLMPNNIFAESPWNFESTQLSTLRARLAEQLGTLKEVCHVKVGLQVLWNDAYQIIADKIIDGFIYGHSKIDDNVIIEYKACRPLLCNERFAPLTKREYKTFAIFPYSVSEEGKVSEISISDYTAEFPKAGKYLTKHKAEICKNVQTLPKEQWHLFTRANNHGAIYQKLCVPMTAKYPQASVVLDKHVYCDNANMFFIQIENVDETRLYALAAIINSTIFYTFAKNIANPQSGGYFKFNKQFLDPIPVPREALLKANKDVKNLASIAKRIEDLNEQLNNCVGGQTSGLSLSLEAQWRELDNLCMKLYGIKSAEDKALIFSNLRNDRKPYGQED